MCIDACAQVYDYGGRVTIVHNGKVRVSIEIRVL